MLVRELGLISLDSVSLNIVYLVVCSYNITELSLMNCYRGLATFGRNLLLNKEREHNGVSLFII